MTIEELLARAVSTICWITRPTMERGRRRSSSLLGEEARALGRRHRRASGRSIPQSGPGPSPWASCKRSPWRCAASIRDNALLGGVSERAGGGAGQTGVRHRGPAAARRRIRPRSAPRSIDIDRSDFGRKLYLIQNGIYGVDIQPIACQIAKLRFFISLAIEQKPDPAEPNLGIKPLPNLETRFVAADTLIGLQNEADPFLLDDRVVSKRNEIAAVRERYFLADSRPKKLECIKTEQRLRSELRAILEAERQEWVAAQERDIEARAKGGTKSGRARKFPRSRISEACSSPEQIR